MENLRCDPGHIILFLKCSILCSFEEFFLCQFFDFCIYLIASGALIAGFVNAAFATGGIYIQLAVSLLVLSPKSEVALQAPLSFTSLSTRIYLFWYDLQWPYIYYFIVGCFFGVSLGAVVFSQFS